MARPDLGGKCIAPGEDWLAVIQLIGQLNLCYSRNQSIITPSAGPHHHLDLVSLTAAYHDTDPH